MRWARRKSFRISKKCVGESIKVFERAESALGKAKKFSNGQKVRWARRKSFRTGRKCVGQAVKVFE